MNILLSCSKNTVDLIRLTLAGCDQSWTLHRVDTRRTLLPSLDDNRWDVVICESQSQDYGATDVIDEIDRQGRELPLIVLADSESEPLTLAYLKRGVEHVLSRTTDSLQRLPYLIGIIAERQAKERRRRAAARSLFDAEERYLDVFDNTSDLIQCLAPDGSFLYTNRAWREAMGYTEEEVGSLILRDVLHPDSVLCCQDRFARLKAGENLSQIEFKFVGKSGETVHLFGDCGSIIKDGEAISTRGIFKNNTAHVKVEKALQASEARYQALYENAPDIYTTINAEGTVLSINRTGAQSLGYTAEELIGRSATILVYPDDLPQVIEHIHRRFAHSGEDGDIEYRKVRKDGSILWVHQRVRLDAETEEPRLLVVCRDISDRKELEDQLSYQATHDALTNLVNRREFESRLRRLFLSNNLHPGEHMLCYLDLDQFKVINDTCGHIAGDELLRQIASLLTSQIRARDTLARLGGDEFAVLMEHCPQEHAGQVAEQLRSAIEKHPFQWHERRFTLGVSIGVVPLAAAGTLKDILNLADSACYSAKQKGRNRVHIYRPDDRSVAGRVGDTHWASTIAGALEDNRFQLYAQPIQPRQPGDQVRHLEILLRLHDNGQLTRPGAFMPAAERYNLSPRLDRWVIDHTLQWFENNAECADNLERCSVNLSALSLCDETFPDYVLKRLEKSTFPNEKLCFEVTETAAIANLTQATAFMHSLRAVGCSFALDDFGSGLSSFAYLRNLPVDMIKIDGAFVRNIAENEIDRMMVKSICDIGTMMGKQTTAEYVEDAGALEVLQAIGVDFVQGHYLGKPAPLSELTSPRNPGTVVNFNK